MYWVLTFDIQVHVGRLAHAKGVLSSAAVETSRVPGDRAKDDLLVRAEDILEAFLPPGDGGRWVAVNNAPQGGVVLLVFQVVQLSLVDPHHRRVWMKPELLLVYAQRPTGYLIQNPELRKAGNINRAM